MSFYGIYVIYLPIFFMVASQALGQSSACEAAMSYMGKIMLSL